MAPTDDDLLQPTLTPADDLVGFDRPWSPTSLLVIAGLFGPWAAAFLLAKNQAKLGLAPDRRILPAALALGAGVIVVAVWAYAHGLPGVEGLPFKRQARNAMRWGNLATIFPLAVLVWPQVKRWRVHQQAGHEAGGLWKPGALAVLAALVAEVAVAVPLALALGAKLPT